MVLDFFRRKFGKTGPMAAGGMPAGGRRADDSPFPPLSVAPPDYNRFAPADVDGWRAALDAYGFVVISGVLSPGEVAIATSLLWDHLEDRTQGDRCDPRSWTSWPEESFRYGMIQGEGTHCDGVWFVRGLRGVRAAFANLFGDRDLHVSFDGFPALRPAPALGPSIRDWYHIDHSLDRLGRWLAQGLVALTPSGPDDGGLVVWPCSHHHFPGSWGPRPPSVRAPAGIMNDFVRLKAYPDAAMPRNAAGLGPVKLCTAAGDLILWDSRTVHCNAPPGPIPGAATAVPALADLLAAANAAGNPGPHGRGNEAADGWAAAPTVAEIEEEPCSCAACRGDIATRRSAPLGRLGVYVCMQPAARTEAPPRLRETMMGHRAWTGHAPFRDVGNFAGRMSGDGGDLGSPPPEPPPRLVVGCRVRRALAGLE